MKKSIVKSIVLNLVITVITSLLLFLINRYFAEYMGIKNLGLMKLFTQLVAYLNLAEMGLGTASAYSLYKPLAEKNYKKINILVSTIESLYNKIVAIIVIIGIVLIPIIPFIIKEQVNLIEISTYWILYIVGTASSYLYAKYVILFTADQKFNYVRIVQGISKIIIQSLQIYVIIFFKSFMGFISLMIIDNIIQYILYFIYYKKYYSFIKKVAERENQIKKDLVNLFFHKLGGVVVFNTDYIIISKFISLEIVGIYANYILISSMLNTIFNIVFNVMSPKIGNFIAINSKKNIYNYFKELNIFLIFFGGVASFCSLKLMNTFVSLWIGKDYILENDTVILLAINIFILITRNLIGIFKNSSGYFRDIQLPLLESFINLSLSVILVQRYGLNGVIFGTLASNILIIYLASPILVFKNCFDETAKEYLKLLFGYIFLLLLSYLVVEYILRVINIEFITVTSWIEFIKLGMIILFITSFIFFITFTLNTIFRMKLITILKKLKILT